MARILVHVEGETEETFVREILAGHLLTFGHFASARLIGNSRMRMRRGGIRPWPSVRKDIMNHLQQDSAAYATTMVDYYALPSEDDGAWPGRAEASNLAFEAKAPHVCTALSADIAETWGGSFDSNRFIPYVMMHEFEGLLFSDCHAFAAGVGMPSIAPRLLEIRGQFSTPEEINDSALTAPSKRVEGIIRGYEKPFHGNIAILEIGLETVRRECPIFAAWVTALESLP